MDRPTLIQLLSQAAFSATGFLVPVLAAALGADLFEVGLVGAAYGTAQFMASATGGHLADAHGRRRLLKIGLAAAAAASLLHVFAWSPASLAASRGVFGFAAGLFPPALLSLAYDRSAKLGRFTGWGGLGFAVGAFVGAVATLNVGAGDVAALRGVFFVSTTLLAAAYAVSLTIHYPPEHDVVVHLFPKETIRRNGPAYTAMVLRHVGAAAVWIVLPVYLVGLGLPIAWVALIHAVNGIFQFVMMPQMDRFRPVPLVVAGCILTGGTFGAFLLASSVWHFLLLQPFLALSWACLYMGTLKYILDHMGEERATATGLLQSSIQLSNVVGPIVGGAIAFAVGVRATFAFAVVMSVAALAAFALELALQRSRDPARPCATADS